MLISCMKGYKYSEITHYTVSKHSTTGICLIKDDCITISLLLLYTVLLEYTCTSIK